MQFKRKCRTCRKTFTMKALNQHYCSTNCRVIAYQRRKKKALDPKAAKA